MSFIKNLFSTPQAAVTPALTGIPIQTSTYGRVISVACGTVRAAPNLIWYDDFKQIQKQNTPAAGSGKGGLFSGGSSAGITTSYQAALAFALCEGPIYGYTGKAWASKAVTTLAALGFTTFTGTYPQSPWGYLSTNHSANAADYNGIAYIAVSLYDLGGSASLPNHSVEIQGACWDAALPNGDADPSRIVSEVILTNPHYGIGFPAGKIASLANYQNYVLAAGLLLSPLYESQQNASQAIDQIAQATNSAVVWTNGQISLVPYGDEAITGNGHTYTPPSTPQYDLADDDFVAAPGADPVLLKRKRPADILNVVKVEYLDRSNDYNVAVAEAKDQAAIDLYGLSAWSPRQHHAICDGTVARLSAQLQLQREAVANTYEFTVDARYILLDPMDIVTLTDPIIGLDHQWVRITEISEQNDGTLAMIAEEYLAGSGHAAQYSFTPGGGFAPDTSEDPGNINTPIIFEPHGSLSNGLEIWFAVCGGPVWFGAEVWVSDDNTSFRYAGTVNGAARMGTLGAALPAYPVVTGGQTIDQTNTLRVDLSESSGQLLSGSQGDARNYSTLCYVDGEYLAYATAALVSGHTYDLTYLVRGAFHTFPTAHGSGTPFCRIDQGLFRFPFTSDRIGQTLYFKFLSFNRYRGGLQSISSVGSFSHVLTGVGLVPIEVAFDQLNKELQSYFGFQQDGAQLSADFAAFAQDRAQFAQRDAVARVSTESQSRQDADTSIAGTVTVVSSGLAGEVDARGQAISTMDTRVTKIDGVLQPDGTRLGGSVSVVATAVTGVQGVINDRDTGLAAVGTATNVLGTRLTLVDGVLQPDGTRLGGSIEVLSGAITSVQSKINDPRSGLSALGTATSTLVTRVGAVPDGKNLWHEVDVQSTALTSVTAAIGTVNRDGNGNPITLQSQVSTEITARANFDGSLSGYWAVVMDQGGRVQGMRLLTTTGADGTTLSQLVFEVDKVFFASPGRPPVAVFVTATSAGDAFFGINGTFVVDGSIYGRAIRAQEIQTYHLSANFIFADNAHFGTAIIDTLQLKNGAVANVKSDRIVGTSANAQGVPLGYSILLQTSFQINPNTLFTPVEVSGIIDLQITGAQGQRQVFVRINGVDVWFQGLNTNPPSAQRAQLPIFGYAEIGPSGGAQTVTVQLYGFLNNNDLIFGGSQMVAKAFSR